MMLYSEYPLDELDKGTLEDMRDILLPIVQAKVYNPSESNNPRTSRTVNLKLPDIEAVRELYDHVDDALRRARREP